jgi:site-specific DNA-cytosine methylase
MRFLSVCSGIEAASVAWNPLGWKAVAFSEIEPFPCAVLAHHYPDVPNRGDMTKFQEWPDVAIDLLCGGTPCQSFSQGGLRKGLADPRGNLMLTYGAIAAKYRPRLLVWENVPGVLSSNGGRDFGTFLGMLGQLGYGFAYRVLNARYIGVPQQRRRVFVVGHLGGWQRAAAVLFERESLRRIDPTAGSAPVSVCLTARGAGSLDDRETYIVEEAGIRHMTPLEGERLQGFPDNYTAIPRDGKPAADGPRNKAIGNSWAVPVARWIGWRIDQVEALRQDELEAA